MQKQTYQEVMWLSLELGRRLRSIRPDAPEGADVRALFKTFVEKLNL